MVEFVTCFATAISSACGAAMVPTVLNWGRNENRHIRTKEVRGIHADGSSYRHGSPRDHVRRLLHRIQLAQHLRGQFPTVHRGPVSGSKSGRPDSVKGSV